MDGIGVFPGDLDFGGGEIGRPADGGDKDFFQAGEVFFPAVGVG